MHWGRWFAVGTVAVSLGLASCGGKEGGHADGGRAERARPTHERAAAAKSATAPTTPSAKPDAGAAKPAASPPQPARQATREALAKAFEGAYCAVYAGRGDPKAAYAAAGFDGPEAWYRAWKERADAEPKWAMKTVRDVVEGGCGTRAARQKGGKHRKSKRR